MGYTQAYERCSAGWGGCVCGGWHGSVRAQRFTALVRNGVQGYVSGWYGTSTEGMGDVAQVEGALPDQLDSFSDVFPFADTPCQLPTRKLASPLTCGKLAESVGNDDHVTVADYGSAEVATAQWQRTAFLSVITMGVTWAPEFSKLVHLNYLGSNIVAL